MRLLKSLFKFKTIADPKERLYGIALRFLGIDIMLSAMFWLNDFALFDIRVIRAGGCLMYLQILGFILFVGRNDLIWESRETISL